MAMSAMQNHSSGDCKRSFNKGIDVRFIFMNLMILSLTDTTLGKRARQSCTVSQEYPSCENLTSLHMLSIYQNSKPPLTSDSSPETTERKSYSSAPPFKVMVGGNMKASNGCPPSVFNKITMNNTTVEPTNTNNTNNGAWGWFVDELDDDF